MTLGDEYFYQVTSVSQQSVTPETPATDTAGNPGTNPVVHLNTDDNPGQTSTAGNVYDDIYPTWSPFTTVFSIAYSSNRTVTYTNANAGNVQSETAVSIGQGQALPGVGSVGSAYAGILVSQVLNLDPPTLLAYNGNEIVHVTDGAGNTTRSGIQPGQPVTLTVRLSSREAGIDDTGGPNGGPNVYIQVKDPDSKYQDSQGLEHKVFAKDQTYRSQRNNPNNPYLLDSGSSTVLMNGGAPLGFGLDPTYTGFNQFPFNGRTFFDPQRGSVGGIDGPESDVNGGTPPGPATNKSDTISVGRDGGGTNPYVPVDAKDNPILDANKVPVVLPGGDPNLFIPWGPEFECQVVNPDFGATGATDTLPTDYRDPYYLAGVDDQQPFSGAGKQRPTVNIRLSATQTLPAEWLQLSRLPAAQQDGQGGVLYSVTWKTPTSGSDYYLDVIAFDKAIPPPTAAVGGASNWRIYDNVWGFSTAPALNNNDILVVSDYALGQKFAATTFGGQSGLLNLVPKLYGAESYVTDIDVNLLPNAIYRNVLYPGADANNGNNYTPEALDLGSAYDPNNNVEFRVLDLPINGLGVGSYVDVANNDGGTVGGAPAVRSQQYSLWRILARGPVPPSVYQAYEPTIVTQPAVTDPLAPKGLTSVPAGKVPVANRCILWLSPFTGDVLAGPGTLLDANTQAALAGFVGVGGRLCVSGQNVASAVTQNGTSNNTAAGFLSTVLGATFATAGGGTQLPTPTGQSAADNRITNLPSFDGQIKGSRYPEVTPSGGELNITVGQRPIRISNNYGGNIFQSLYGPLDPITPAFSGNWRTDGSLDQLGPYIQPFPSNSNNSVVGRINTITPNKGAHVDINLAPFVNPIGTTGFEINNPDASSEPGGTGLIYTENPILATGGTGSKAVFATFGLEALSTEYYKQMISFKPNPIIYAARNQRQNLLHNIVSYLRTGSITGTIIATSGNGTVGSGVPGVTVYVVDAYGVAIPGRGTFSALSDSAGTYRIDGLEPGSYTLVAYKAGFTRTTSNPNNGLVIEGDVTVQANLTINPTSGGSISGNVSNGAKPVAGASVVFTSSDGTVSEPTTTDSNGNYSLPSVPPGTYTGQATDPISGGVSPVSMPVTVTVNSSATINFVLKAGPGTVTGRVLDALTNLPIPGATVSFLSGNPPTVAATATTDSTGTYTATKVPAGSYTLTAGASGYGNSAPQPIVVTGNQTTTAQDLLLGPVVNGFLGGLVTSTSGSAPVGGVTISIVNTGTGLAVTGVVSTGTATTGQDGSPLNYGPVTVAAGTYTVTASASGVTTGSQTVTITDGQFTRVDFTGVAGLPAVHTFSAGLNFLSTPYDYSSLGFNAVLGTLNTAASGTTPNGTRSRVAVWDPTQNAYALDPNPPADTLRLGRGYWVFLKQPASVTQTGGAPSGSVAVALSPYWNQIGVPNLGGVPVSSLTFDMGNGQAPLSFASAAGSANHVVSATLYRFDGANYQPVAATDTLQPWNAYWIKVFTPTTVRIPTGR